MSWEGFLSFAESLRTKGIDPGEAPLRVVVYENPFARIPLRRDIFTGPFDERFGPEGDHLVRVFAGAEILRLEEQEKRL